MSAKAANDTVTKKERERDRETGTERKRLKKKNKEQLSNNVDESSKQYCYSIETPGEVALMQLDYIG
jgi:hypothetical protein